MTSARDVPVYPIRELALHLKQFDSSCVVSVGSGEGDVEFDLIFNYGLRDRRFILVDPNPSSFRKVEAPVRNIHPDYKTTRELIESRPGIVNACVLLLILPDGGKHTKYDLEAIHMLKPEGIVLYYELTGKFGGSLLHSWLYHKIEKNPFKDKQSMQLLSELDTPNYEILKVKQARSHPYAVLSLKQID